MKHADLVSKLTLAEKCALLQGATTFGSCPVGRLGIPSVEFSDGPSGVRHQAGAADHLGLNASEPATCFPTAVTVANTWDPALAERVGAAMGEEAAAQGVNVLLAPGLNIKRNPLCGRNFEYYSEDPLLSGETAAAMVRGIQSTGVAACPKHFAVNSQETRRQASDSVLDERTLRELYLAGFERVVREAHPLTIMTSYNLVNGVYANESKHLLKDVLRDEWGFDGAVVTDWGGSNDHAAGVAAGSTIEMPAPGLSSARDLERAVRAGGLSEADVDERVDELIELALQTQAATAGAPHDFDAQAHHELAREVAAAGCVLLKNEHDLLPLAPDTRVALVGDFARAPRYQGAGSSAVNSIQVDTMLELIGQTELELVGFEPGFERDGAPNERKRAAALDVAGRAEVVVLCLGLDEIAESEGSERTTMSLCDAQVELLHDIAAVNPNVVVLLSAGAPVACTWEDDARAVVYGALGGEAGAGGALDVLTGRVNPAGRLAETWPVRYEDVPSAAWYPAEGRSALYREGIYVGYRYYQTAREAVAHPFGYGLSYTRFSYANLEVAEDGVSFTLTNTGERAGAEVAQLYVAKPEHHVFRPEQELRGFAKVELAPGEARRVHIPLSDRAFSYYNVATSAWEIEAGAYELRVGASSEDIRLTGSIELAGTGAPDPYEGMDVAPYETADRARMDDEHLATLLGRPVPAGRVPIDRNMCFCDLNHGRSPLFWLVWFVLRTLKRRAERKGAPDLNVLFVWNMPLRAIAKMTNGAVNMRMVDALVMEVRGFWIIGLLRFAVEALANIVQDACFKRRLAADDRNARNTGRVRAE